MRTFFAIACLALAMTCASLLLFGFLQAVRGKKTRILRSAAALILMIFALWQSYLLMPVPTVWIAYACTPAAIAGALLILLSGVREMTSDEPSDGPERRIPAMAMRVPQPCGEKEEDMDVAMGGGRVA
jgi:hypothetical protein